MDVSAYEEKKRIAIVILRSQIDKSVAKRKSLERAEKLALNVTHDEEALNGIRDAIKTESEVVRACTLAIDILKHDKLEQCMEVNEWDA